MTKTTARNHRRLRNRHRYLCPQWTSAQAREGIHHTWGWIIIHPTLAMRFFFLPSSNSPPPQQQNLKRKLSLRMSFPKRGGATAEHACGACGHSLPEPKDIQGRQQTKNSRLKISYTCNAILSSFVHICYVVVTYQPHAHIGISCKRYVVFTNRSMTCASCKRHVCFTCNFGELIQIRTVQLRNKRIFIWFPHYTFILLDAIFKTILTN